MIFLGGGLEGPELLEELELLEGLEIGFSQNYRGLGGVYILRKGERDVKIKNCLR